MLSQESSFIIRKMVSELQVRNKGCKLRCPIRWLEDSGADHVCLRLYYENLPLVDLTILTRESICGMAGRNLPTAMPATIHNSTHKVRYLSKNPIFLSSIINLNVFIHRCYQSLLYR